MVVFGGRLAQLAGKPTRRALSDRCVSGLDVAPVRITTGEKKQRGGKEKRKGDRADDHQVLSHTRASILRSHMYRLPTNPCVKPHQDKPRLHSTPQHAKDRPVKTANITLRRCPIRSVFVPSVRISLPESIHKAVSASRAFQA